MLAVDFNPREVRQWRERGKAVIYGDACDPDFISGLPLNGVKWVISAMPQHDLGLTHKDPRLVLIDGLKERGFEGKVAISTQNPADVETLEARGAGLVLLPFHDAAEQAVTRIKQESL